MASVSSHTRTTLGVNAAFLQEVKDSNLPLWATLRELRELAANVTDRIEASRQFVNRLDELRDSIGLQFSLEETYGFVSGVRSTVAFGCGDARDAQMQHRELYLQLHELCEQVEEAQYRGTISRDFGEYYSSFEAFDACFRAHEELEAELIRCGLGYIRPLD